MWSYVTSDPVLSALIAVCILAVVCALIAPNYPYEGGD